MTWLLILTLVSPSESRIYREYNTDYTVLEACRIDGENQIRKLKMPVKLLEMGWKIEYKCKLQGTDGKDRNI